MASKKCTYCHNFDPHDVTQSTAGTKEEQLSINISLSDLQINCIYCSLLRRMVLHFAPGIEQSHEKPFLRLDLDESCAASAEVMGRDPKENDTISLVRFFMYMQENVGRSQVPFVP